MKAHLLVYWQQLQSSLWFVPALMLGGAIRRAQTAFGVLIDAAYAAENEALAFRLRRLTAQAANTREKVDAAELV